MRDSATTWRLLTLLARATLLATLGCGIVDEGHAATETIASSLANDTKLIHQGYEVFASFPASSWTNGNSVGQANARYSHSTVWSGTELIIWGGNLNSGVLSGGGAMYRPDSNQWTPISPINAPLPRTAHSAIWTGHEMLIWGGFGAPGQLDTGARFEPTNQLWKTISAIDAPSGRQGQVAVWTGTRMIIWGGRATTGLLTDGALYTPATDTWSALTPLAPPSARSGATAVWTGSRMLIWGGLGAMGELGTGAQLLLDQQGEPESWQPIANANAPSARTGHIAVWTGTRMIVWGGKRSGNKLNDGASYDPIEDVWTPLSPTNAPAARSGHGGVWTGAEILIWGGESDTASLASGAAYHPLTQSWRPLNQTGGPLARSGMSTVWSGTELLVFGGRSNGAAATALQRLNPQPAWYLYRIVQSANAPTLGFLRSGGGIELRWPFAGSAGFVLERAAAVSPTAVWSPIATAPVQVNDQQVVNLIPIAGPHFFRLRRQ